MKKVAIFLGFLLLAGCATNSHKQAEEVEGLCVTGALAEYESRTSDGWLKFRCR